MRRILAALLATAAITPTVATSASAASVHGTVIVRVYDPYRHDYHRWDGREQRAYRAYLNERHRSYIAYRNQRLAERRAYWHWRHEREERLERR
jgi:hypothetical protein